jgi:hypothetical protein
MFLFIYVYIYDRLKNVNRYFLFEWLHVAPARSRIATYRIVGFLRGGMEGGSRFFA